MYPLKKLQNKMLNLAVLFDDFCKVNDLDYAMCGGTLIGAVRHSGFIPWDDDFDVIMPRHDFNKFLKLWEDTEGVALITTKDKGYHKVGTPAKLYFTDTRVAEINEFENGMPEFNPYGIFIDIFPVDKYPDSKLSMLINKYWGRLLLLKGMSFFHMAKKKKDKSFRLAVFLVKFLPSKLLSMIDKVVASYIEKSETKTCKVGYGRETPFNNLWLDYSDVWPAKRDLSFEGHMFKSPRDSDKYLKSRFGDYMVLPPVDSRYKHVVKVAEVHDLD